MKKTLTLFTACFSFIFISCEREATGPEFRDLALQVSEHLLPGYFVTAIAFDSKGTAWMGTFKQGLIAWDDHATFYNAKNSALAYNSVRDVVVDGKNNKWIAISEVVDDPRIIRIDGEHWTVIDKSDFGFSLYYFGNLTVDTRGRLWASIDYSLSSLLSMARPNLIGFDGEAWTINNPVDETGAPLGYVWKVAADLAGNIWASLRGRDGCALAVYNGRQWFYNDADFPAMSIFEIAADNKNRIWLGTGDGIYLIVQ